MLENLYRAQCVGADAGLGAMIISPTRELATQIFEVLYKIGKYGHMFAAGLVIGGKGLREERDALLRMNIVVCTPGRMLQHLSQTASFNTDNLRMLVLDEADRILDMGFAHDVDAILDYLPRERQTLLFSATQTKKVSDLARLSLNEPEYVSVHEGAATATPAKLQQNYTTTTLPSKLDTLWSFLQSAKKSKTLVFLSSGKQVRFTFEAFRRLQPGVPLLHLHGRQKQYARMDITAKFAAARYSVLFATDVAARGLDFPAVDWVVQLDAPEDADTYIHRVGRTARYERDGRAVLFLDPSEEEGMLTRLAEKKVPVERINIRQAKQKSIKDQLQHMLFQDPEIKYLGQKAFASYARSLYLQKDKSVFPDVSAYDWEGFAASLGLPGAPKIRFVKGDAEAAKRAKNAPRMNLSDSDSDSGKTKKKRDEKEVKTRYDRLFARQNQDILAPHYQAMLDSTPQPTDGKTVDGEEGDDDLFTVKTRIPARSSSPSIASSESNSEAPADKAIVSSKPNQLDDTAVIFDSKRRQKALKSKKKMAKLLNLEGLKQHLVLDESTGTMVPAGPTYEDETAVGKTHEERAAKRLEFEQKERERMVGLDEVDREEDRRKKREKKWKQKAREREVEAEEASDEDADGGVSLPTPMGTYEDFKKGRLHEDEDDEERSGKRQKKWFENDKHLHKNAGVRDEEQEPETLEDLERLAAGYLD